MNWKFWKWPAEKEAVRKRCEETAAQVAERYKEHERQLAWWQADAKVKEKAIEQLKSLMRCAEMANAQAAASREREAVKLVVKTVAVSETSIGQWRMLPVNVQASKALLADPVMAAMVHLLEAETPAVLNVLPRGTEGIDVARCYGENVGYLNCLEKLKSFGRLIEEQRTPTETFEDE